MARGPPPPAAAAAAAAAIAGAARAGAARAALLRPRQAVLAPPAPAAAIARTASRRDRRRPTLGGGAASCWRRERQARGPSAAHPRPHRPSPSSSSSSSSSYQPCSWPPRSRGSTIARRRTEPARPGAHRTQHPAKSPRHAPLSRARGANPSPPSLSLPMAGPLRMMAAAARRGAGALPRAPRAVGPTDACDCLRGVPQTR
eukprot:scaffold3366_cov365-Prasinococcus_capsulatus_cf.AAC.1